MVDVNREGIDFSQIALPRKDGTKLDPLFTGPTPISSEVN